MFTVDFRFEENQTTIEFPCNEEYLSSKFDELGVKDKLKMNHSQVSRHKKLLRLYDHFGVNFEVYTK